MEVILKRRCDSHNYKLGHIFIDGKDRVHVDKGPISSLFFPPRPHFSHSTLSVHVVVASLQQ